MFGCQRTWHVLAKLLLAAAWWLKSQQVRPRVGGGTACRSLVSQQGVQDSFPGFIAADCVRDKKMDEEGRAGVAEEVGCRAELSRICMTTFKTTSRLHTGPRTTEGSKT